MFSLHPRLDDIVARRAGRIAFGVVLVAGASVLISREFFGIHAAPIIVVTWMLAFWLAAVTRWAAPARGPHHPDRLFAASVVVPSVGVALMLPLTIHLPFFMGDDARQFDEWVQLSLIIAGPTHIALAIFGALRGARLVEGRRAMSPEAIFGLCLCVACVPFIVIVIPVLIVGATGLPILALLAYQERLVRRERAELAGEAELPAATMIQHAA